MTSTGRWRIGIVGAVLRKVVVSIVGFVVLAAGVVMLVAPGPGVGGIVLGLTILATEYRWAKRWLTLVKRYVQRMAARGSALAPNRRIRVLAGVAGLAVVAVAGGAVLHTWPDLGSTLTGEWLSLGRPK